jgi:hypothetical protein
MEEAPMALGRGAIRRKLRRALSTAPRKEADAVALAPDAATRLARRRALGFGALASLLAFIGRSAARAADALTLTIDADGVAYFNGKRNNFKDEENKGWLRVGAAWGVPGIYSEAGPVVVTSQSGIIWLPGNVVIKKADGANSLNAGGVPEKEAPLCNLDVSGTVKAQAIETAAGESFAQVRSTLTTLQNAIQSSLNNVVPIGAMMLCAGDSTRVDELKKQGWLFSGATVSETEYPDLSKAIGTSLRRPRPGYFWVPSPETQPELNLARLGLTWIIKAKLVP